MSAKKKILFVRAALGQGGADRVAVHLIKCLLERGFGVKLLLMKKEGEFLSAVPQEAIIHVGNVKSLWYFIIPLWKVLKKEKPDVVFSLDGGVNALLGIISIFYFGPSKIVVSERSVLIPSGKNPLKYFILALIKFLTYRYVDKITAVSEGLKNDLISKLMLPKQKINVVFSPLVDEDLLVKSSEPVNHPWFGYPRKVPVIVHAGRFVHQKNHASLIRAFARASAVVDCRLFLLGDGPLKESCKKLVVELNIEEKVCFGGFDINPYKYFSRCDLFVLSSRNEGMPGVLIQALACGAPVVSTYCPFGPSEILGSEGEYGILVPVDDVTALANAMVKVLTDSDLRGKLKSNAPLAVKKFSYRQAVDSYVDSFR